jgi:hypothetical protein
MGSSPKIEDMRQNDDAFRKYLTDIQTDLDAKSASMSQKVQTEISDFYTKNHYDDAKLFASGQNTDFVHQEEFTMDNLKKVIDSISAAVFSGAPVPKGTDVNQDAVADADKALGKEVGAMANLELYIAGKVFDVLSNVVLSFGTGASVTYSTAVESKSLGFGMQMFTAVAANSYQSHSFFNNQYISQYLYMYNVRFSVKQAQVEATIGLVQAYQNQMAVFEDLLNKLGQELDEGTIALDAYETMSEKYQKFIDQFDEKISSLKSLAAKWSAPAVTAKAKAKKSR